LNDHYGPIYSIAGGAGVLVIIVSILRGVAALVVGRDTREGIIAPVEAYSTLKVLLHQGLGARATSKVSVAPDWRERRSASGEVVFGQRREAASSVKGASAGGVLTVAARETAVIVARMERRRVGGDSAVRGKAAVVHSRLPVDRLKAVPELGRRTEFPFADYGPDDCTTSHRRGKYDDDGQGGVRQTRATSGRTIVDRGRGRSRRDVASQRNRIDRGRWLIGQRVGGRSLSWSIRSRGRGGSGRGG